MPTILVLDDAADMRIIARRVLEPQYRVLEAPAIEGARLLIRRHPGPIDLLIAELGLRNGNSKELGEEFERTRQGKVLYTVASRGPVDYFTSDMHVLPKPYTVDTLRAKVEEVLGNPIQAPR